MPEVVYTPMALEDLKEIKDYLTARWGANAAEKILKKMVSDIRSLERYPLLGADLGQLLEVPTAYRYLFSERNYIFYRPEAHRIHIIRILNEKQDYTQKLFDFDLAPDEG